ncbi:unnamed protein product, partial [Tetraodon nigroviridis]
LSRVKKLVDGVRWNAKDLAGRRSTPLHFAAGNPPLGWSQGLCGQSSRRGGGFWPEGRGGPPAVHGRQRARPGRRRPDPAPQRLLFGHSERLHELLRRLHADAGVPATREGKSKIKLLPDRDTRAESCRGTDPDPGAFSRGRRCWRAFLVEACWAEPRGEETAGSEGVCWCVCFQVVSLLLCQGADPNARDNWNYTPLHEAAIKGKIDVCIGGSVSSPDSGAGTPGSGAFRELFEACRNGDVSRVKKLVDGVSVNAKDLAGRRSTPLHFAAGFGRKDVVDHLLCTGANVHARDDGGLIPLHNACSFGHSERLHELLRRLHADAGVPATREGKSKIKLLPDRDTRAESCRGTDPDPGAFSRGRRCWRAFLVEACWAEPRGRKRLEVKVCVGVFLFRWCRRCCSCCSTEPSPASATPTAARPWTWPTPPPRPCSQVSVRAHARVCESVGVWV